MTMDPVTAMTAVVLILTAAANIAIAVADLRGAAFVRENSTEVAVPSTWLPCLAALKGAGGASLLLWFVDVPLLPLLGAAGLVCFFTGAVAFHIRHRVFHNIAFPGLYLALAVASLVLLIMEG